MNKDFSIAFKALKQGLHHFNYDINSSFFEMFKSSPIKKGDLSVDLEFNKRTDHFQLDFEIKGTVETNCDRCTATIQLPVENASQFIIKFGEGNEEAEVIYIPTSIQVLELKEMIYETIVLSIPLIKTYDCDFDDPIPCNNTVLDYLETDQEKEENSSSDSVWDKLNEIKFNDN